MKQIYVQSTKLKKPNNFVSIHTTTKMVESKTILLNQPNLFLSALTVLFRLKKLFANIFAKTNLRDIPYTLSLYVQNFYKDINL